MAGMGVMGKLILGFVAIILGAVLISVIATNTEDVTTAKNQIITDESIDISSARDGANGINVGTTFNVANVNTDWKTEESDCDLDTPVTVSNSTTAFTVTTDYTFSTDGTLTLVNSTNWQANEENATLVDYTYCPDDYMNIGWGRSVLNLIAGFFALAVLGAGLGLFYSVAKETGIIN